MKQLTETAEHVARTRDLSRRIRADGTDELSRLGASFNTMLEALADAERSQRQLVADASHELRTPLTSLRTNIEVLSSEACSRRRTTSGCCETWSPSSTSSRCWSRTSSTWPAATSPSPAWRTCGSTLLVEEAVERARRHASDKVFFTELEPCLVEGVPGRLDRAVTNLLDNAAKWSPDGGQIEVRVRDGEVACATTARASRTPTCRTCSTASTARRPQGACPGSGLGLAIVRQVAESHGGAVVAERANGGGAQMSLKLPVTD